MKVKEFVNKFISNRPFRWYILAGVSCIMGFIFAIYNLAMGVAYGLVWHFSVSFYYLFLAIAKIVILYCEKRWKFKEDVSKERRKLFKISNVFLLLIDLVLVVPITLMLLQRKPVTNLGTIPTIAVAVYTTYKIVIACVNYKRSNSTANISLNTIKTIGLKEAIVSILTLQNTMITVFGGAESMKVTTMYTSIALYLLLVAISIYQFIKINELKKN